MRASDQQHLAEFGLMAAEFLHDLASEIEVLRIGSHTVAMQARAGHIAVSDATYLHAETERMARLFSDVLSHLRAGMATGRFSPAVQLEASIRSCLHHEGSVSLETLSVLPEGAVATGPASFFHRIVTNLVRNAFRHAHRRVRVSLLPERRHDREGYVLAVEDDGRGIDAETAERIFQPFVRGEGGGQGLGLSSVRWLTEQLGGDPTQVVASAMGGASFEVWLPLAMAPPTVVPRTSLAGRRVVLIDDQDVVRRSLSRLLERYGATVALIDPDRDLLHRLAHLEEVPDLVLLDRDLGPALDGMDVWQRLRAAAPQIAARTALLTGSALSELSVADEGPPVLSKPVDVATLEELLSRLPSVAE